jgi:hypothetical protein
LEASILEPFRDIDSVTVTVSVPDEIVDAIMRSPFSVD